MNSNKYNQTKNTPLLDIIKDQFKCSHCGTISQPIQEAPFAIPPEYSFLDIHVCTWCNTGFVITDTNDGFGQRHDLSNDLVASWSLCSF